MYSGFFARCFARRHARPDNLYLLGLGGGLLLMTPMCAVACWNVAAQEDKALFGRISRCVLWKHVEAVVSFCVYDGG